MTAHTHTLHNADYAGIAAQIPDLMNYALARCANPTAAEDLVQECILRALTGAPRARTDRELHAWLFTILHNLCISRPAETSPGGSVGPRLQPTQADQHIAHSRLLLRALAKAAMAMPVQQRRIAAFSAMEDLSSGWERRTHRTTFSRQLH